MNKNSGVREPSWRGLRERESEREREMGKSSEQEALIEN
jgi:hypothetical protein